MPEEPSKAKQPGRPAALRAWAAVAMAAVLALPGVASGADPRIVGGREVDPPGAYPFVVALEWAGIQFCGGSVISPEWVLTAAHCVDDRQASQVDVVVGRHDLRTEDGERIPASAFIIHPGYDPATLNNDAALVRLSQPTTYGSVALPPDAGWDTPGRVLTVAGWGRLSENGARSPVLYEVDVPLVSDEACYQAYRGAFAATAMICAGDLEAGGVDSCFGDSGGPLFATSPAGFTLIGLVSWGEGCARPGFPGVYTRVSAMQAWVTGASGVAPGPALPRCAGFEATILGTPGDDVIRGTTGDDVVLGYGGNDVLYGLLGDDVICGGGGADRLFGGKGTDRLYGGPGADEIYGGGGPDRMFGGGGNDFLEGNRGRDTARGGPGFDVCLAEKAVGCEG